MGGVYCIMHKQKFIFKIHLVGKRKRLHQNRIPIYFEYHKSSPANTAFSVCARVCALIRMLHKAQKNPFLILHIHKHTHTHRVQAKSLNTPSHQCSSFIFVNMKVSKLPYEIMQSTKKFVLNENIFCIVVSSKQPAIALIPAVHTFVILLMSFKRLSTAMVFQRSRRSSKRHFVFVGPFIFTLRSISPQIISLGFRSCECGGQASLE